MDFSQPFRAVTPTLDGPALRVLARTTHPMTRQQVADLIGEASEAGVRKVLRRLAEQGVVIEQRIGTHYTYVGNREHILWPAVEVFMSAADRLDTTIREHVEAWGVPALSVELFGSVAAGTSTADSDIDLMVYRPFLTDDQVGLWDSQIAELRMAVERWTGNACEILEIDPRTLVEMAAEDEPVLKAPRVPISGLNIAAAFPSMEIAKSIQKAMASSDASRSLARIDSKRLPDAVISPELRRTMEELHKVFDSPAMKDMVKKLGSPQVEVMRKQQAEVARVAKSPATEALQAAPLMAREDKTRSVDRAHAETRLNDARAFLQQADVSLQFVDGPRRNATVVSSAVLAGIAACDAACALALGMVSTGAHDQAVRLLTRVSGSTKAVGDLSKLVAIKTAAQYTGKSMAERQAMDAITRAQRLIAFAESQLRR